MGPLDALLQVSDYTLKGTGGCTVRLPQLQLPPGGVAALYGPSGCGKTSMLVSMFGLLERRGWSGSGAVRFGSVDLVAKDPGDLQELRRSRMAFLMQDAHNALDPLVRVGEQVQAATGKGRDDVEAVLSRLGVEDAAALCERQPHRISGGQAQRVLLSIAFLRQPALVIADEPSASLDGGSYAELVGHLRELIDAGSALMMATHDHRLLRDLDAEVYALHGDTFERAEPDQEPWPARPSEDVGAVAVLEASGVRVCYGSRAVLDDVDFVLRRGEIVALLGESGAGKTTLMRVLAGHRRPDRGVVDGPPRRAAVQLVCQDAFASLTPRRTLRSLLGEAHASGFDAAAGASSVRLPVDVLDRTSASMSGGERRRAGLLRAIAVQPDVLLLDEPTASLDRGSAVTVIENLLAMRRSRALALVVATHDESLAEAIAHRRLILKEGRLCEL